MYRVIDTVSIDVMSITRYHLVRKPRKESGVEGATMREVRLGGGVIRYRDVGTGPVLFFVHGILVNGTLWRHVVANLAGRFRCIVPDLPLGGHSIPMEPGADMSPPGVARMVADLMRELDLRDVTLVGNDTGGAICQLVISNHPERIGRLVLDQLRRLRGVFPCGSQSLPLPGEALRRALRGSPCVDAQGAPCAAGPRQDRLPQARR